MTSNVVPAWATRRRKQRVVWSDDDKKTLTRHWTEGMGADLIADLLGRDTRQVYSKAHGMGLPPRRGQRAKAGKRRIHNADPSGQRRKVPNGESKGPRITLEPHDPRSRAGITVFPTSVLPVAKHARLLKSGDNSYKIGRQLTKGRWKGFPIYTLTLEERATCPRSCKEWSTCYGNNMPFANRIHDDGTLTKRLWGELASLAAQHPGFVVRLHVLGDFSSVEYVEFWRAALDEFPQLHIFGFTARIPPDPIGWALVQLTADQNDRFRMRFSGAGFDQDCSEVVDRPEDCNFVRCPAETDPKRSCATCGLCMQGNVSISFVRH